MSTNATILLGYVINTAWLFACFGTTAYVVFWRDASGWWFLLAILVSQLGKKIIRSGGSE